MPKQKGLPPLPGGHRIVTLNGMPYQPEPTTEERIRKEEQERILREDIRKDLAPKPTPEGRIAKIDERMLARQGKRETYQEKIKGKKVTEPITREVSYQPPPESVILVYKRNLARLEAKDRADNKLLVKLTGEQAGRKPAPGQYAGKMGPPKPETGDLLDYAEIEVDESDGTIIRDPQGNLYVVRNGRLTPKGI